MTLKKNQLAVTIKRKTRCLRKSVINIHLHQDSRGRSCIGKKKCFVNLFGKRDSRYRKKGKNKVECHQHPTIYHNGKHDGDTESSNCRHRAYHTIQVDFHKRKKASMPRGSQRTPYRKREGDCMELANHFELQNESVSVCIRLWIDFELKSTC